jgi:cell fate regulator YaaT (PSP1 superfamily)
MMIEVVFKGERKEIYANPQQFPFKIGDYVIVEAEKGEDLGLVHLLGSIAERKKTDGPIRNITRKATAKDIDIFHENSRKEFEAYHLCRKKIVEHGLDMKLVDVEYQFDGNKITFYFTAEKRIDFRELVKELASIYKVRIELRQIGVRDEAKRIGGYGSCGRKLCCTTFLKEFEPITTQSAKEQNLPLNPQKLSGLCGRLLCCIMYEREFYKRQTEKMPPIGCRFQTPQGTGVVTEHDVFHETVTLQFAEDKRLVSTLEEIAQYKVVEQSKTDEKEEKQENV